MTTFITQNIRQNIRISLLAIILGGILFVLGRVIFLPQTDNKTQVKPFIFPEQIPLPDWEFIESKPLTSKNSEVNNGQEYQYFNQQNKLDIQARYEQYSGDINRFIVVYNSIPPATANLEIKSQEEVGFYAFFRYEERVYLTACINAKGKTTVTGDQFTRNKYTYTWELKRTLFWLIGQQDLLDSRCLWSLLSIPLTPSSNSVTQQETYQTLEKTWFNWYEWWKNRFPPS